VEKEKGIIKNGGIARWGGGKIIRWGRLEISKDKIKGGKRKAIGRKRENILSF